MTVGLITRMLPLKGNAHHMGQSVVYFETRINSGIERKRTDFKKGDIAFLPTEGCICFYMDDVFGGKQMTIVGKITGDIKKLKAIKSSDVLSTFCFEFGTVKSSESGYIIYELDIEKCILERFQELMSF